MFCNGKCLKRRLSETGKYVMTLSFGYLCKYNVTGMMQSLFSNKEILELFSFLSGGIVKI